MHYDLVVGATAVMNLKILLRILCLSDIDSIRSTSANYSKVMIFKYGINNEAYDVSLDGNFQCNDIDGLSDGL